MDEPTDQTGFPFFDANGNPLQPALPALSPKKRPKPKPQPNPNPNRWAAIERDVWPGGLARGAERVWQSARGEYLVYRVITLSQVARQFLEIYSADVGRWCSQGLMKHVTDCPPDSDLFRWADSLIDSCRKRTDGGQVPAWTMEAAGA